jgi:exopolysaccharide biosynthesis polyprenyl glycosylphosphotransferase
MRFLYRLKQLILAAGEILCFSAGLWLALTIRNLKLTESEIFISHFATFLALFLLWIVANYINNLYDLEKITYTLQFYKRFIESTLISLGLGFVFFYLIPSGRMTPKTILVFAVIFGYCLSLLWRYIFIKLIGKKTLQTKTLFIGYTKEVEELLEIMDKYPERGYECASVIDPEEHQILKEKKEINIYTSLKAIRPSITTHKIKLVIISPHLKHHQETLKELYELLFWPTQITDLTTFYQVMTGRIPPSTFSEGWFLDHLKNTDKNIYNVLNSGINYILSIAIIPFFFITFPLTAILIKINSKGPIFIKQKRVGRNGKIFTIYKYRSMYSLSSDGSAETHGVQFATKDDERITRIGKILRKTRMDELPQILNLLKGDITLIGPRPERPEIVEKLEMKMPYYSLRHMIKPGLTGWAAVNQHYTDTMETSLQKLQYDLYYIKNRSFLLDISIILKTINVVLRMMGQ